MKLRLVGGGLILVTATLLLAFQNCAGQMSAVSTLASNSSFDEINLPSNFSELDVPPSIANPTSSALFDKNTSLTVEDHHISSELITCEQLNPDSIKALPTKVIELLGTQLSNGFTLHHHYLIGIELGYKGKLGKGELAAWWAQNPNLAAQAAARIQSDMQAIVPTFNSTKGMGYLGVFSCGGGGCYLSGGCDKWGRRL